MNQKHTSEPYEIRQIERRGAVISQVDALTAAERVSLAVGRNLMAASLLRNAQRKGVRIWQEKGSLRYAAPRGAMTEHDLNEMREHKEAMIELLQAGPHRGDWAWQLDGEPARDSAPLSFSQLAHWNLYNLGLKRSVCIVPLIVHIAGRLNISALKTSASDLMRRHGALRTRITMLDGKPRQKILSSWECPLIVQTRNQSIEQGFSNVESVVTGVLPCDVDVCSDPLFGMRLLTFEEDDHILVIFMEHIISDGWSMGVVWRDLLELYEGAVSGSAPSNRRQPLQLGDYAALQDDRQSQWLEAHEEYWRTHFRGCSRVRIPSDRRLPPENRSGWGVTRFRIPEGVIVGLQEWSRRQRTTVVIAVFTAYVAFVLRWCNVSEMVILMQTDGRTFPGSEHAIGYFAFPLYLRMRILSQDDFGSLKNRVIEEYVLAAEHADCSWGESQAHCADYMLNTRFNWLPDSREHTEVGGELAASVMREVETSIHDRNLANLERDTEPMMMIMANGNTVEGEWQFPRNRFNNETMERFVGGFLRFLGLMLECPAQQVAKIPLVR